MGVCLGTSECIEEKDRISEWEGEGGGRVWGDDVRG